MSSTHAVPQDFTCPHCKKPFSALANHKTHCPQCHAHLLPFQSGQVRILQGYIPNQIPLGQRIAFGILSLGLIVYCILGLAVPGVPLPGKSGAAPYEGIPGILILLGILCFSAALISVIIDHYDRRDNERAYRKFFTVFLIAGLALSFLAIGIQFISI